MKLELKLGRTGKAVLGFVAAFFFAYLGVVFAYRINYNNPSTFKPYFWQFVAMIIVARIFVSMVAEFGRRIGVR